MEFEEQTIVTFVIMVLFLTIVLGNAKQVGAFDQAALTTDPTFNYNLSYNLTNITFFENPDKFKPPTCENLGQIPILSDMGCVGLLLIWLSGLKGITTDFMWFNYIWIIPLSIIVSFAVVRFLRGN